MSYTTKHPLNLIIISIFVYLLTGCGATSKEPEANDVVVAFSVNCDLLVCHMDVSETISGSDTLSSLLCAMGDGSQVDPVNQLEIVYDYTYAAPGLYDITCTAQNSNGDQDSLTTSVNIDGIFVDAGSNQTVSEGTTVTLNGSLSEDTIGSPINLYRWTNLETNIPRLTIVDSETVSPTFVAPSESNTKTYRIRLVVSIDNGFSFSESSDIVDITVIPAGGSDL